ncbi:MAG: tungsten ABC transporter substrate-binding protein [Treponema sp. GWB1_62_6]|nr:MAG: tungsten ABC transporter substrate-binding protein [Treponema sp. GWB1_62_6]
MNAVIRRISIVSVLAACFLSALPLSAQNRLKLATTTSTEQSGLLSLLLPVFEKKTGLTVDVVAVGTGAAIKLGEKGDADVLLVHARAQEDAFMAAGFGDERKDVFYNDFIIVGPESDPAKIASGVTGPQAFARIAAARIPFISRGDNSGTHVKEKDIWKAAGMVPAGTWYKEAGQGMSQTIMMADQMGGYVLADRATWLAMKQKSTLVILNQGDPSLFNPYGVISISAARYPTMNKAGAKAFVDWMTGPEARSIVSSFRIGGEPCFFLY